MLYNGLVYLAVQGFKALTLIVAPTPACRLPKASMVSLRRPIWYPVRSNFERRSEFWQEQQTRPFPSRSTYEISATVVVSCPFDVSCALGPVDPNVVLDYLQLVCTDCCLNSATKLNAACWSLAVSIIAQKHVCKCEKASLKFIGHDEALRNPFLDMYYCRSK